MICANSVLPTYMSVPGLAIPENIAISGDHIQVGTKQNHL